MEGAPHDAVVVLQPHGGEAVAGGVDHGQQGLDILAGQLLNVRRVGGQEGHGQQIHVCAAQVVIVHVEAVEVPGAEAVCVYPHGGGNDLGGDRLSPGLLVGPGVNHPEAGVFVEIALVPDRALSRPILHELIPGDGCGAPGLIGGGSLIGSVKGHVGQLVLPGVLDREGEGRVFGGPVADGLTRQLIQGLVIPLLETPVVVVPPDVMADVDLPAPVGHSDIALGGGRGGGAVGQPGGVELVEAELIGPGQVDSDLGGRLGHPEGPHRRAVVIDGDHGAPRSGTGEDGHRDGPGIRLLLVHLEAARLHGDCPQDPLRDRQLKPFHTLPDAETGCSGVVIIAPPIPRLVLDRHLGPDLGLLILGLHRIGQAQHGLLVVDLKIHLSRARILIPIVAVSGTVAKRRALPAGLQSPLAAPPEDLHLGQGPGVQHRGVGLDPHIHLAGAVGLDLCHRGADHIVTQDGPVQGLLRGQSPQ